MVFLYKWKDPTYQQTFSLNGKALPKELGFGLNLFLKGL